VRTEHSPSHPRDPSGLDAPQRDAVLPDAPPLEAEPGEDYDYSVLGDIEREAIGRLTVTLPSTVIRPDRPSVPLVMLDFREALLRGKLSQQDKDRAWRHLAELARAERGEWNLFALGTSYPGLRKNVNRLTADQTYWQRAATHFTIAIEFLFALHRLPLDGPHVFNRFVDAAYTHTSGRKRQPKPETTGIDTADDKAPATATSDSPEAQAEISQANTVSVREVLDRVITQINTAPGRQRITDTQAVLISRTYLDGERLRDVAAEFGLSEASASKQRKRAARLIVRVLDPDLADRLDKADTPKPRTGPDAS
jgi:hypothetical protein